MTVRLRKTFLAGALASAPFLFVAQPAAGQAVVQALPPPALADLNSALKDLARSPRSVPVLLRAAWASIELDDNQAALGFFRRAEAVEPANGEVKAGMATIELRQGDPVAAVRLFSEAEGAGVPMARFAADRGLAYDLVGDNASAQRFYREALAQKENPDVVRRLAVSQAIAGDQRSSEATLLPLLQRSDLAAYRSRAFALAILGKSEEAVSIAQTMLPGSLSNRMAPYLRYMPRLTRAQQAAAANLGRFPPADQIGRDKPEIAALSQQAAASAVVAARTPDSRLEPAGQPLGSKPVAVGAPTASNRLTRRQQRELRAVASANPSAVRNDTGRPTVGSPAAAVRPAPTPSPAPTPALASSPAPAPAQVAVQEPPQGELAPLSAPPMQQPASQQVAAAAPAATQAVENTPQPALVQPAQPQPQPASSPPVVVASAPVQEPPHEIAPVATQPSEAPRPSLSIATPSPAAEPVPDQQTLADAFADFSKPAAGPPASGAVDITKIKVQREKPPVKEEPKPEKPKPPANPSRVWVQVATGRDTKALAFDWRRITREAGPLLAKRDAFIAKWGQTNRLLTGPYDSQSAAQKAVAELKKKGLDSFTFTSDEGEAVNPLK